jgi:Cys-rich protein (TIGR01571 family)
MRAQPVKGNIEVIDAQNTTPIVVVQGSVVPVQAQPVIYQAHSVVPFNPSAQPYDGPMSGLPIPYPGENRWHNSEFERCCACSGDCWLAWCCPCVPLAHMSSKLKAIGSPYCLSFSTIIYIACFLSLIDFILSLTTGNDMNMDTIFCAIVCFQIRGKIRERLNIAGNCCTDMLCSICCLPCVLTQINGTLWKSPGEVPGCSMSDNFANVV